MQNTSETRVNAGMWTAFLNLSRSMEMQAKAMRDISDWLFALWLEEQDIESNLPEEQ